MTREAEQRELRLRDDMEKLRTQQEQTLGTLDTKIDAMMERRTQAIMDRLDGLHGSRSGPREREPISGGPSREPTVNFKDHQRRRTYGFTRGRGSSSSYTTSDYRTWGPTVGQVQQGTNRPQTNDRRKAYMQLGEVTPATGDIPAEGGVMCAKDELVTVIRIVGMHQIQNP